MVHKEYLFGIGITLDGEFQLADNITLRPAKIDADHHILADMTNTEVDYGLVVATYKGVTFELEVCADSQKDCAIGIWNSQWLFILLSIVLRTPLYHPIHSFAPSNALTERCLRIQNGFISPAMFRARAECTSQHLKDARGLQDIFGQLTKESAFSHAATVAAHSFNEPKASVRMAAIWSGIEALLNVQSELSYRIPMLCALMLAEPEQRLEKFQTCQGLYNARSKCVHGSAKNSKDLERDLSASHDLLFDLLMFVMRRGSIPTPKELKEYPLTFIA